MDTREICRGSYFPTLPTNAGNLTTAQGPHGSSKAVPDAGHILPSMTGNTIPLTHHDRALIRGTTHFDAFRLYQTVERFPLEPRTSDPELPQVVDAPSLVGIKALNVTDPRIPKRTRRGNVTKTDRCSICRVMKIKVRILGEQNNDVLTRWQCKQLAHSDDPRCLHCLSLKLPITLCVRQAIYEVRPFEKCTT